jgi:hypothetical protein
MQASVSADPALRMRSQLLWEDRYRSTRGPKAAFSPEEVVSWRRWTLQTRRGSAQ